MPIWLLFGKARTNSPEYVSNRNHQQKKCLWYETYAPSIKIIFVIKCSDILHLMKLKSKVNLESTVAEYIKTCTIP